MSKLEVLINKLKCCLGEDSDHFAIDSLILKCGGNACKRCIESLYESVVTCRNCKKQHLKDDINTAIPDSKVEYLIKEFFFEDIKSQLIEKVNQIVNWDGRILYGINFHSLIYSLKLSILENNIENAVNEHFNIINTEIEVKIESLIEELHIIRDTLRKDVSKMRENLLK